MSLTPHFHTSGIGKRLPRFSLGVSVPFSDAPADHSPDVLADPPYAVSALADAASLPEHGPGLVRGTISFDDAPFLTKITVHCGTAAFTRFGCVALLDPVSAHNFIDRVVLEQTHSAGATTVRCEQNSAPRS